MAGLLWIQTWNFQNLKMYIFLTSTYVYILHTEDSNTISGLPKHACFLLRTWVQVQVTVHKLYSLRSVNFIIKVYLYKKKLQNSRIIYKAFIYILSDFSGIGGP